ncbi:serine/threonine-protein kinase [Arthrobacter sp. AZCC_0090]|uniref:serine/threonine-protein kinase n=1 Tax=Arthrobacter sp. AZCC_0090 TaxID=2735881 RepID=UPI00161B9FF8|nr:serine/threonine-protein kinase [Arthrobacter sp. AZCC_0090]MBB6403505.1 serine/threonine protein kinase [Arthrobacter sp. AZCC_0090]
MSSKRPAAPPPSLPGYKYISLLGSGGFSDVYLYEQDRPRRRVAVKVLLSDLKTEGARRRFESEANLMAQLSSHPYIVTIFEAQSTETGHSYLAMEYCSRPSLDVRYRRQRFSVDEVLAVGIQVASAVETAHRAGIVHRDIKPANILVTDYNRPALTDFGISGTIGADADDDAGMSIPWSPPEQFRGGPVAGVPVDVWALGATLYTLLAGRSPYVMPGQDNSQRELIARITNTPVPRLGRADVPESLELVLSTAMAKSPGSRYSSAHAFALALQRIQAELNLSVTPFEVLEEPGHGEETHPDDTVEETRVRSIASIDPDGGGTASTATAPTFPARTFPTVGKGAEGAAPAQPAAAPRVPEEQSEATVLRGWAPAAPGFTDPGQRAVPRETVDDGDVAATVNRPAYAEDIPDEEPPADHRKRNLWLAAAGAAVLVVAAVVGIALGSTAQPKALETGPSHKPADAVDTAEVPGVTGLKGQRTAAGKVAFTWTNPQPKAGDTYKVQLLTDSPKSEFQSVKAPSVEITPDPDPAKPTCVRVVIVRADGATSSQEDPPKCVSSQ